MKGGCSTGVELAAAEICGDEEGEDKSLEDDPGAGVVEVASVVGVDSGD